MLCAARNTVPDSEENGRRKRRLRCGLSLLSLILLPRPSLSPEKEIQLQLFVIETLAPYHITCREHKTQKAMAKFWAEDEDERGTYLASKI